MAVFLTGAGVLPKTLDPVFANNSWEDIIIACQSGEVPAEWKVGDSKPITIGTVEYQFDIIGKSHDDYADGTGKALLTLQMHDVYSSDYRMNNSDTNSGGWDSCQMRKTHLPSLLSLMPIEVQNGIREVSKKASAGNGSSTKKTSTDKLFLLSEIEVTGSRSFSTTGEGTQYDYYKNDGSKIKYRSGSKVYWWLRSPDYSDGEDVMDFCCIGSGGGAADNGAYASQAVSFAFCL